MSDGLLQQIREYVHFHEMELRERGLLVGDELSREFRAALLRVLRGELPSTLTGVPLPEPPPDRPE